MYPEYALLTRHERSGLIEEEHYGLVIEYSKNGLKHKAGNDNNYLFFQRSCMKPMQLASIMDIFDEFNFTSKEIAVSTASHAGDDIHIETVKGILKKIGLTESDLLCPAQVPLSYKMRNKLAKANEEPGAIHNNCSGKHAAMLAYCVMKGYDIKNYNDKNHPLQRHVLNFVAEICGTHPEECVLTKDGCTLPVLGTPLQNLAKGFLEVFINPKYLKIKDAILENPYYLGGEGRTDSEIIAAGKKNLIAKVGAGNLCCVVDLKDESCIIIKLLDPDNFSRGFTLVSILNLLGKLEDYEHSELSKIFSPYITDEAGDVLGKIQLCF